MALIALGILGLGVVAVAAVVWQRDAGSTQPQTQTSTTPRTTADSGRAPTSSAPAQPVEASTVMLPDARSLPAGELSIESTADGRRLRFSATLANSGTGPLEVVPNDSGSCPAGQRYAEQRLYLDTDQDRAFDRAADLRTWTRPAGCMLDHPDHDHWHFDAMARYALTPVGSTTPVAENTKISFCLRDNVIIPGTAANQPQHYGECQTRLSVQGISPGWADVYTARLADQYLDLPDGLVDGAYCLHTEADPNRLLRELDPTNNAAVLTVQITGTSVSAATPNQCRPLPPRSG
jgi:hypothetical protein